MNFIEIIMMLFPGMVAADYYNRINKKEFKWNRYITNTVEFALYINLIEIVIIYYRGWIDFSFEHITAGLMIKYLGLGIVLAYVFPYVYKLIRYIIGRYITGSIKRK